MPAARRPIINSQFCSPVNHHIICGCPQKYRDIPCLAAGGGRRTRCFVPSRGGPPIIGEEARSKIPKFRSICSDKFSKIFPKVFGLPQAFAKNFKFCSDSLSGLKKWQFCSDQPIWPQKKAIFPIFRLLRTNSRRNHSPPIPSAVPPRPFLRAATIALTAIIKS